MKLKYVTITGADNNTQIEDMISIFQQFPFVEWGILFSPKRSREPRYPSIEWLMLLNEMCKGKNMNLSAHICGGYTKQLLQEGSLSLFFNNTKVIDGLRMFTRAQLNFNAQKHKETVGEISPKFYEFMCDIDNPAILQMNKSNAGVCIGLMEHSAKINILHDASGGRGTAINDFIEPYSVFTGYAGGLNPDNLKEKLEQIAKVAQGHEIWIDTESGVRTNDVLDMDKVVKFLEIAKPYTE